MSAHFALRIGPFWHRGNQLHPTPFSGSPPPSLRPPGGRCSLHALLVVATAFAVGVTCHLRHRHQRPRLSRAPAPPLSASPSPPTLHSFSPDRHEIPETEQRCSSRPPAASPPSASPPSPLSPRRPVAARQLHQLFSSHRVSPSPSRFSLLLLLSLARL